MRIAMLAPISWRTPPRHYGPWELVTSLLTEALVARGVDVTLFATADSITAGTLAGVCPPTCGNKNSQRSKTRNFKSIYFRYAASYNGGHHNILAEGFYC